MIFNVFVIILDYFPVMKIFLPVSIFLVSVVLVVATYESAPRMIVCDVGQGDATLVVSGSVQVLIDGGPGRKVLDCLSRNMPFWDKTIEVVVLSHPDYDHLSGVVEVLGRYQVMSLVTSGYPSDSEAYQRLINLVEEKSVSVLHAKRGTRVQVADIGVYAIWPITTFRESQIRNNLSYNIKTEHELFRDTAYKKGNDMSLVVYVSLNGHKILFPGDIGHAQELALYREGLLRPVEILKVPHHGSKYSSDDNFIRALEPKVATIGVGANNTFGHPHPTVLSRLEENKVRVWRTDLHGQVVIYLDSGTYRVMPERITLE